MRDGRFIDISWCISSIASTMWYSIEVFFAYLQSFVQYSPQIRFFFCLGHRCFFNSLFVTNLIKHIVWTTIKHVNKTMFFSPNFCPFLLIPQIIEPFIILLRVRWSQVNCICNFLGRRIRLFFSQNLTTWHHIPDINWVISGMFALLRRAL